MSHASEPEPLAYRVKPHQGECFDSWLDRLASRHEISRAQLFKHFGYPGRLASLDLCGGPRPTQPDSQLLRSLLWDLAQAVDMDVCDIYDCFVEVHQSALLPPALRHYVCPQCWLEGPRIVKREWILRASWCCSSHDLPLQYIDLTSAGDVKKSTVKIIDSALARALDWKESFPISSRKLKITQAMIEHLINPRKKLVFKRGQMAHCKRLMENEFHLTSTRINLLQMAHSQRASDLKEVARFENFLSKNLRELAGNYADVLRLNPPARGSAIRNDVLVTGVNITWECDIWSLVEGYIRAKRGQESSSNFARRMGRVP